MSKTHSMLITQEILKSTCETGNQLLQTTECLSRKLPLLKVVFMHNLSGKVQLSFLFIHYFFTKTLFFPKIIFLFFCSKARGKKLKPSNICCQKSDISYFTLLKDKWSSWESTRLDLEHLHSLLNKNWCLLFSSPIPVSWSTDSEQDPGVNDNYWNTELAKTSRDMQLSPWHGQEHLNISDKFW